MKTIFSLPFLGAFVCLFLLSGGQSFSQNSAHIPVIFTIAQINNGIDESLNNFEDQLFFKQYPSEDEKTRLSRIEKQIFGESYNDSVEKRVARIKEALPALPKQTAPGTPGSSDQQNIPMRTDTATSSPPAGSKSNSQLPSDSSEADQEDKAERERLRVMSARAYEINTLLAKAVSLYRQKHLKESIAVFNQVIRLDSENASAHFSLGIALEASGDSIEAANHYQRALDIEPDNKDYQLAMQGLRNKSNQQNKDKMDQYKIDLLASQAGEAFKQGNYEQSLELNKKLDTLNPNQALIKYNIGTIYLMLKKPKDALPYYKAAHKLEPANAQYSDYLQKLELTIKNGKQNEKPGKANNFSQPNQMNNQNRQQPVSNKSSDKWILANFGFKVKSSKEGVKVKDIVSRSRAAQVGLQNGDIIKVIDGLTIYQPQQVEAMLGSKQLGQRFQFLILRNGRADQLLF